MALLVLSAAFGCDPRGDRPARAGDLRPATVAELPDAGLALEPLPDGRMIVLLAGGRMIAVDTGRPDTPSYPVTVDETAEGLAGVRAFAAAPDFTASGVLYLIRAEGLERRRLTGDRLGAPEPLRALPDEARTLAFGPDGALYVGVATTGWTGALAARRASDPRGSILRLDREGHVPADNPLGPTRAAFATGLADPVDLGFDSSGRLLVADDAPGTGGRLVRLGPGDDAGWPWVRAAAGPIRVVARRVLGLPPRLAVWWSDGVDPVTVAAPGALADPGSALLGLTDGRVIRLDDDTAATLGSGRDAVVDLAFGTDGRLYGLTRERLLRFDPGGVPPPGPIMAAPAETLWPTPRPEWERRRMKGWQVVEPQ